MLSITDLAVGAINGSKWNIAQLVWTKTFIEVNFGKRVPIRAKCFRRCQGGMVASKSFDKLSLGRFGRSPAEFCESHG
jgi:hypothetical protein